MLSFDVDSSESQGRIITNALCMTLLMGKLCTSSFQSQSGCGGHSGHAAAQKEAANTLLLVSSEVHNESVLELKIFRPWRGAKMHVDEHSVNLLAGLAWPSREPVSSQLIGYTT